MVRFIGRISELNALQKLYKTSKSELIIVYGRRRIGKTTLIYESIKNNSGFYYMFSRAEYNIELTRFTKELSEATGIYLGEHKTFYDLFKVLAEKLDQFVIALDEFTYVIEKENSIVAEFQKIWDTILKDKNIKLILSGSCISMMETEVLGYNSPLYGRRSAQIKLDEFSFDELRLFFPNKTNLELIKIYSALGGVPFYLEQFDKDLSFAANVENTFFNKSSILYEEAEFLLREELREPEIYFRILSVINNGSTKLNEIATKSYLSPNNIHKYLSKLELLQIISKKYIVTEEKKKSYIYEIKDKYFRFWQNYIYPNRSLVEIGNFDDILKRIEEDNKFYSKVFEELSRNYIISNRIFNINNVGNWWYGGSEIDVVGINEQNNLILFGECKFQNNLMDDDIYGMLLAKKNLVKWKNSGRKEFFVFFSKSGFTKKFKDLEKRDKNIKLVCLKDF